MFYKIKKYETFISYFDGNCLNKERMEWNRKECRLRSDVLENCFISTCTYACDASIIKGTSTSLKAICVNNKSSYKHCLWQR